jgi:HAD superfamily hydrolase (TIGR01509 family)
MNIIIPIGGKGERFKKDGYSQPKHLIEIFGKPMILYVLDNLSITSEDNVFIITYNQNDVNPNENFENIIHATYPNVNIIYISKQTQGAAETILLGIESFIHKNVLNDNPVMILDCDTFYTYDVVNAYRMSVNKNAVFYTINTDKEPIYSYILLDTENIIIDVKEKMKISHNANTGIYCFKNIHFLYHLTNIVLKENKRFNNEFYTSCVVKECIHNETMCGIEIPANSVFNLGTPAQLLNFINNKYAFLFDLDGTLVLTDDIYYDTWKEILQEYNIVLTFDIFKSYICGNSDINVVRKLIPKMLNMLKEISDKKDSLFIKNIHKIRVVPGAIDFIKNVYNNGHRLAIVTNCNRRVADYILHYLQMNKYFHTVIVGGECANPKPQPDPYKTALKVFNMSSDRAIIFEDSKTGFLSANSTSPKCIVGIETMYSHDEVLNSGANISIKDFINITIDDVICFNNLNSTKIKSYIRSSMCNENILDIIINDEKLKGGFISDVVSLKIITDKQVRHCVLKLESKNVTFLSKMSNELGLYEREYYFYSNISQYIPIKCPPNGIIIKDENFDNIGILMDNLFVEDFKINLNLNKERLEVSLSIIEDMARMHAKFWNKNLQQNFKELKKHNDPMFYPKWSDFIHSKWEIFKNKWSHILSNEQITSAFQIVKNFSEIQNHLSTSNLTLCHGDIKSANIFYKPFGEPGSQLYKPYFIDWQYVIMGKGVQDLVFFMIESFDIDTINKYRNLFKEYYYVKLLEFGVKSYSIEEYQTDFDYSIKHFPFFVAIWFGTLNEDELIDKNFPFFFIQKLFNFIPI